MALEQEQVRFQGTWPFMGSARDAEERYQRKLRDKALERFELANEGLDDIDTIKADYVAGKIDLATLEDRIGRVLASRDDPWYT